MLKYLLFDPSRKISQLLVKNCEGSEILLYLQAAKLICISFRDDDKRHKISGIREEGLYYWKQWLDCQHVYTGFPGPNSNREMWKAR